MTCTDTSNSSDWKYRNFFKWCWCCHCNIFSGNHLLDRAQHCDLSPFLRHICFVIYFTIQCTVAKSNIGLIQPYVIEPRLSEFIFLDTAIDGLQNKVTSPQQWCWLLTFVMMCVVSAVQKKKNKAWFSSEKVFWKLFSRLNLIVYPKCSDINQYEPTETSSGTKDCVTRT